LFHVFRNRRRGWRVLVPPAPLDRRNVLVNGSIPNEVSSVGGRPRAVLRPLVQGGDSFESLEPNSAKQSTTYRVSSCELVFVVDRIGP
jgi:hypothetical protein